MLVVSHQCMAYSCGDTCLDAIPCCLLLQLNRAGHDGVRDNYASVELNAHVDVPLFTAPDALGSTRKPTRETQASFNFLLNAIRFALAHPPGLDKHLLRKLRVQTVRQFAFKKRNENLRVKFFPRKCIYSKNYFGPKQPLMAEAPITNRSQTPVHR